MVNELRFVVSQHIAEEVRRWARLELEADPHAAAKDGSDQYQTTTLYFDTPEFDLFFRLGSQARAMFSIRSYDHRTIFLERKLRAGERVLKRRSAAGITDLPRLGADEEEVWSGLWFARRLQLRKLRPVCQVTCRRTARTAQSGLMRITIDEGITAVPLETIAFTKAPGIDVMPANAILELKYGAALPSAFADLIHALNLRPQSVSKYHLAVQALGLADDKKGMLATPHPVR
jgi:hypothetical protein